MPKNKKSKAVLKSSGFEDVGFAKDYLLINGKWEDHNLTALINIDCRKLKNRKLKNSQEVMSYISLDEYPRKWIFTHQSMPLSESDLEMIKRMTQARAAQLWKDNISAQSPDADRFSSQTGHLNSELDQRGKLDG